MPIETVEPGADITLASTTETQEELDHATSPEWRKPFSPKPAVAEGDKAGDDKKSKTEAGSDPAKTAAKTGEEKDDDLPPGAKKRIGKLTARLRETEEELAELKRTGKSTQSARETVADTKKAIADTDPEPILKNFKTWEEWNAAHNRWTVRDENRKQAAKDAEQKAADNAKQTYDSHLDRVHSFAAEHDDFEETVKSFGKFTFADDQASRAFQLAIVEDEAGPALLYHLCKNPDEMEKFSGLSAAKVQLLMGRMLAKLNPEESADNSEDKKDAKDKSDAAPAHKSKAPAPTTQVKRSTAAPATDLADPKMNIDQWIRKRNEDERTKKRR